MSGTHADKLVIRINSGSASSAVVKANMTGDAAAIGIFSPAGLDAHTFGIEVNDQKDGTGVWARLKDRDGNDTKVPAASQAMWYPELPSFLAWRITDFTGVTAGNRDFVISKLGTY